jgi:hypothetical protein
VNNPESFRPLCRCYREGWHSLLPKGVADVAEISAGDDGIWVAVFDYDNDGRLDIFFANGARIDDPTQPDAIPQK